MQELAALETALRNKERELSTAAAGRALRTKLNPCHALN